MSFPQRTYSPSPTTFLISRLHPTPTSLPTSQISRSTRRCARSLRQASPPPAGAPQSAPHTPDGVTSSPCTQPTRRAPCDGVVCSSTAGLARSPAPLFPAPLPLVCLGPQPPPNCCPQPSPPNSCTHLRTQILCVVVRVDGSKETRADTGKELA